MRIIKEITINNTLYQMTASVSDNNRYLYNNVTCGVIKDGFVTHVIYEDFMQRYNEVPRPNRLTEKRQREHLDLLNLEEIEKDIREFYSAKEE